MSGSLQIWWLSKAQGKTNRNWKTFQSWPECISQEERKKDKQPPNHITSSRWIMLKHLRKQVKKKKCYLFHTGKGAQKSFHRKGMWTNWVQWKGFATASAFTEKTLITNRLWGSPLTICPPFTAQCFDLSLLKPDFLPQLFLSKCYFSSLKTAKVFFPVKAHSDKVK